MFSKKILLLLIILLAIFFRFNNLKWDSNFHLHPDERFLTMVGGAMQNPHNISEYLDPNISTFNPANIGYKFYVYGTFPLTLNKLLAQFFHNDTYNSFTTQGRFLSALADLLVIFFVYKTVELFEKKYRLFGNLKYYASFFYAISVLPIQLSHFYTTDSFMNFFTFGSFYFSLKFYYEKKLKDVVFSGIFIGLAIASKISAIYILPLIIFFVGIASLRGVYPRSLQSRKAGNPIKQSITLLGLPRSLWSLAMTISVYFFLTYLTIRLADPYYFATNNFFDFQLNQNFLESIKSLGAYSSPDVWYPPGVQWIHKGFLFGLQNIVFYGVGIVYTIFSLIGIIILIKKYRKIEIIAILFWCLAFFIYQSVQFAKTMRYFIILYPFLAIFAGFGLNYTLSLRGRSNPSKVDLWLTGLLRLRQLTDPRNDTFTLIFIIFLLIWPVAFSSIYFNKNSRVMASEWIYQHIPNNSSILSEYWDDPLPLLIENQTKQFTGAALPVFDPDTPEKWEKMNLLLKQADYYILSSNRGWGSIPTVPEKYPLTTKFYQDLFAGKTNYKLVKEFHSYPSLQIGKWKWEIPDDLSEEAFTVYDHPEVFIFKNEK